MIFLAIPLGIAILVTSLNGNILRLGVMLRDDVVGTGAGDVGYIRWFVAIVVIGSLGYVKPLKGFSDAFLVLIVLVLFLNTGGGLFDRFNEALNQVRNTSR